MHRKLATVWGGEYVGAKFPRLPQPRGSKRTRGLGFWGLGVLGFRGLGFRGLRVRGLGFRVRGSGFRV